MLLGIVDIAKTFMAIIFCFILTHFFIIYLFIFKTALEIILHEWDLVFLQFQHSFIYCKFLNFYFIFAFIFFIF